jgi:hypothetical protein
MKNFPTKHLKKVAKATLVSLRPGPRPNPFIKKEEEEIPHSLITKIIK